MVEGASYTQSYNAGSFCDAIHKDRKSVVEFTCANKVCPQSEKGRGERREERGERREERGERRERKRERKEVRREGREQIGL